MAAVCPEEDGTTIITTQDMLKLAENAKVISALEDIYSLTQKDRTSRTSVLTPEESWRFQRAAYRIMLYCNLFPSTRYDLDELANMVRPKSSKYAQRTAVLGDYPVDELLEVYAVARFMRDVLGELKITRPRMWSTPCSLPAQVVSSAPGRPAHLKMFRTNSSG
ncbi:hypothetical protein B0H14DRAFT_1040971 [Mycena olivaceomarginata]|nr:hypothetical protein B0H14DRAFT_1040971 [Mycena olivaceomarginata]